MQRLLLALLFLTSSVHAASIQKWVDESGQVHYGDSPPAKINTESVRISRPPSNPGRALPRLGNQQSNSSGSAPSADSEPQNEDTGDTTPAGQEREFCERARKDLSVLINSPRIRLRASDGSTRYMTDEEREARKTQSEQDIERYCK